jgi:hypothetical protein
MPHLLPQLLLVLPVAAHAACTVCETSGAFGFVNDTSNSLVVVPTGNAWPTQTAFSVQGATGFDDDREFLVHFGLESARGNQSRPTPYHDKVTL